MSTNQLSLKIVVALAFAVALASPGPVQAQTIRLSVDFDSMATGVVDTVGSTSPTLSELDAATMGGSWDFNTAVGVPYIREDGGGQGDQALEVSTGSASATPAGLNFDSPIIPNKITSSDPAIIAFDTSQRTGTGFTRDAHWRLYSDTDLLFTLTLDDGDIELNGAAFGDVGVGVNEGLATWDSTSELIWPVSFSIYSDGHLHIDFDGHTNSVTISTAATVDRLEIAWGNTPNGIYLNDITVTDPAPQGTVITLR